MRIRANRVRGDFQRLLPPAPGSPTHKFAYMPRIDPGKSSLTLLTPYSAIRQLHVTAAFVSLALFILRGVWMMTMPALLERRWVKIVPHAVDTVLLGAALWLAWQLGVDGTRGWLVAKVVALFVYIALGSVALKRGRTRGVRVAALFGALATFGYIASVAVTKSPRGFMTWL